MALLVWRGAAALAALYALALIVGVAQTLFDTSAQSMVPMVAPRDRLSAANGRIEAAQLAVREFAGPPVAGLLVGISFALAFSSAAVAYLVGVAALAALAGTYRPAAPTTTVSVHRAAWDGLTYTLRHPLLRPLALLSAAVNGMFAAWMAVFVLHAVDPGPMALSGAGYGLLFTASAAGSLVGTLVVERVEGRIGTQRTLVVALAGWALLLGAPALSTSGWVVGAAFLVGSIGGVCWGVISVTVRQRITPEALLGRVNAGQRLFAWGAMPIGAALGGLVGEVVALPVLFAVTALGTLALAIPVVRWIDDERIAELRHTSP